MNKILIIEARFYQDIADALVNSAIEEIEAAGFTYDRISVPGAFEIPAALSMAIACKKYSAYVCLGCVIRGETSHYDYVCDQSATGCNKLAIEHMAPIGFGIITAENRQQAHVRCDKSQKNIGGKAAKAAISMLRIKQQMGV
jgi:6,7-dimethyl-8-ribityllumazine synthase